MQVVEQIFHKNSETHIRDTVSIMNVLSLQFSLSNDFLSFEFKLMSKVTNFREDIIRDINPYLQNCESKRREIQQSIQNIYRPALAERAELRAKWVSVSCPVQWTPTPHWRNAGHEVKGLEQPDFSVTECGVICIESKKHRSEDLLQICRL